MTILLHWLIEGLSSFTCIVAFKDGKPGDLELNKLGGKIGAEWNTLGLHLGIGQDVLDRIDTNEKEKAYRMLLHWRKTTSSNTLYRDLYCALCQDEVGRNNLAKEFCCKEIT